ncbi:MAG: hypothetical protein KC431_04100, partial [Myxococcales bacterium]|nr:hypothetical protein [Myxococcales bacterium]
MGEDEQATSKVSGGAKTGAAGAWHVSAAVDLAAYSLSWVWILFPLLLLGPEREDYLPLYLGVIAITDLHRHFGLPYVYCDAQVRERYPARFWLFPALMLGAVLAGPWLDAGERVLSTADVCALLALLVLLLQILRRDGGPDAAPVRELAWLLPSTMGAAALLQLLGPRVGLALDGAWWWFAAALLASSWIDGSRLRRSAAGLPARTQGEQAIAVSGSRGFSASLIIVALMGFGLLAGPWIEARQVEGGVPVASVLAFVAS